QDVKQPTASEEQRAKVERENPKGHHKNVVQRAKEEGRNQINLPAANETMSGVSSLAEIFQNYSLLRVELIGKETTISDRDAYIQTWYKCEIREIIHQQPKIYDEPLPEDVPSKFLPLNSAECTLVTSGGEVTVDDVRIIRGVNAYQFSPNL